MPRGASAGRQLTKYFELRQFITDICRKYPSLMSHIARHDMVIDLGRASIRLCLCLAAQLFLQRSPSDDS
jgi:hypothetical protein